MANFDLNFPPTNQNSSFDLNNFPAHNDDDGDDPVVRIISSTEDTIVIDLTLNPAEGSSCELELDIGQLNEESQESQDQDQESQDHVVGDQGKLE